MPSIHPSEDPALGWLVPCLAVKDLSASLDFYAKLDLVRYGGNPAENWAMSLALVRRSARLACRSVRLAYHAALRSALVKDPTPNA